MCSAVGWLHVRLSVLDHAVRAWSHCGCFSACVSSWECSHLCCSAVNANIPPDGIMHPQQLALVRHLAHVLLVTACSKLCDRYLWFVFICYAGILVLFPFDLLILDEGVLRCQFFFVV